jgi:putative ATPase
MIAEDRVGSSILYGPPGTGKTTLARRRRDDGRRLRGAFGGFGDREGRARGAGTGPQRLGGSGQRTILFLDEIHRFNKAQQDALLPAVERASLR